jgi:hypothetical protein
MGDAYSGGAVLTPEGDSVKVVVLDEFVDANVTRPIRVLKIDVEGMEMAVLRGAAKTIDEHRPGIFVEVWDDDSPDRLRFCKEINPGECTTLNDVTQFMSEHGYHMRRKFGAGPAYYFSYGPADMRGAETGVRSRRKGGKVSQAQEALAQDRFAEAMAICEPIIQSDKKCGCGGSKVARAHDIIAVAAWYLGLYDKSRKHAAIARDLMPNDLRVARNYLMITTCGPKEDDKVGYDQSACRDLESTMSELMSVASGDTPYPGGHKGRGIVIVGGGETYGPGMWALTNVLRHTLGVTLPIEAWHMGEREMTCSQRAAYESMGVTCVDALEVQANHPHALIASPDESLSAAQKISRGWALKPYAIAHSSFKEVLYLDSDVLPTRDPSYLFDTDAFRDNGAIFWRDNDGETAIRIPPEFWSAAGVVCDDDIGIESGQIVVDKSRCWKQLAMTNWMNERPDTFCKWLYGDKDTFLTAWLMTDQPFALVAGSVLNNSTGMFLHNDLSGNPLFQHRLINKWTTGENPHIDGFVHEAAAIEFIQNYPE